MSDNEKKPTSSREIDRVRRRARRRRERAEANDSDSGNDSDSDLPTRSRGDELKAMASISEEGGLNDRSMRSTLKPPIGRPQKR